MQITVFGASGKVGRQVVPQLLKNGHEVTVFVHRHNPFEDQNVRVVTGDINDGAAVTQALQGSEAVISTLGSWHTKTKRVVSDAMRTIIPAMEQLEVRRIITLTGGGSQWSGDRLRSADKLNHRLVRLVAPRILQDGEEHIRLLQASALNWTVLRSPVMTRSKHIAYQLRPQQPSLFALIPRAAVARALVDQLNDKSQLHQAPVIYRA